MSPQLILSGLTPHGCFWIHRAIDGFEVKFYPGYSVSLHDDLKEAIQRVKNEIIAQTAVGEIK